MPRPPPPAGFVTVGAGVYISLTGPVCAAPDDAAPTVILIFGWMGALTRHLENYARKYTQLYPGATQIIVKCDPSFFWTSARGKRNQLLPVVEALESLGCLSSESNRVRPRVLVHAFSNGGALQLTTLGRLLSSRHPSVPPLVSALVLDSSPAIGNLRSIGLAFRIAIRNPVVRTIALVLIYIVHTVRLALHAVLGIDTLDTRFLKALLRPRVLPWMHTQTPRLYVFSKKDALVPWRAVQRHAEEAKMAGLEVRCEVYAESAHVAHMRLDPTRYWASVQDLWDAACRMRHLETVEAA